MQLYMVTVQGALLDNVGPSKALLQLPEHMQLNPLLCGRSATCCKPESRDRGARRLKAAPVEVLLLLTVGPSVRVSVVMADVQHNVWVILLS